MTGKAPAGDATGWRRLALGEVGSTNAHAMALARAGERGPLWITATSQTAGRGRSGRHWQSIPGNFYASLLVALGCRPDVLHQLSLVAAVAVWDAIDGLARNHGRPLDTLRLKWPNDVQIAGGKCVGVLAESTSLGADSVAVIGIGINLAAAPAAGVARATSLADHSIRATVDEMLAQLAPRMESWLATWALGAGFADVRSAWLARAVETGTGVSVNTNHGAVTGAFEGLDADGALLIRDDDGRLQRFHYGDVTLLGAHSKTEGKHGVG
jgi:BirA family biotin operon repressor/biotin-[acetyl-CoA-carboxylase] ligase